MAECSMLSDAYLPAYPYISDISPQPNYRSTPREDVSTIHIDGGGLALRTLPQASPCPGPVHIDDDYKKRVAWKYKGYPAFSEWMASSNDFFLLRRFGALNARVILLMQDRISRLEQDIDKIDQEVRDSSNPAARNDSFRLDQGSKREYLLDLLIPKLKEYSEILLENSGTRLADIFSRRICCHVLGPKVTEKRSRPPTTKRP